MADGGKGKGIDKPTYTQTPNILFDDLMRDMGEAELKVTLAVVRKTFGWHRNFYEMSLSDLQEMTGLSRPSVLKGINAGITRGLIQRRTDDSGAFYYGLIVNDEAGGDEGKDYALVRKGKPPTSKESLPVASKKSLPVVVKNFNQDGKESLPEVVNNLYQNTPTLNKEKETLKESAEDHLLSENGLGVIWANCLQELRPGLNGGLAWLAESTLTLADREQDGKPLYVVTVADARKVEWLKRMTAKSICRVLSAMVKQPVAIDIIGLPPTEPCGEANDDTPTQGALLP